MDFYFENKKLTTYLKSIDESLQKLNKALSHYLEETEWLFDWKAEAKNKDKLIYKIVIVDNINVIQGLTSLQDKDDHIFHASD